MTYSTKVTTQLRSQVKSTGHGHNLGLGHRLQLRSRLQLMTRSQLMVRSQVTTYCKVKVFTYFHFLQERDFFPNTRCL